MWRRQALRSVGVVVDLIRILLAAYLVAEVDEALETRRLREQPLDVGRGLHRRIDTGVVHQMHPGWHDDHIPITARPNLLEQHSTDVPHYARHRPPCLLREPASLCTMKLTVT